MEAGCPGRWDGSFAEIRIRLIYAKNCLGEREGILERIPWFTHTDIASDSYMSSPLARLP